MNFRTFPVSPEPERIHELSGVGGLTSVVLKDVSKTGRFIVPR